MQVIITRNHDTVVWRSSNTDEMLTMAVAPIGSIVFYEDQSMAPPMRRQIRKGRIQHRVIDLSSGVIGLYVEDVKDSDQAEAWWI